MPTKTAYHHGNLKPALINAALKELAHEGLEGFSLRGVARRAGVSAPAVYRHFEDKEALLAAVASECAERLGAAMVEAVARCAPDDPLEQFRAIGIAIVRFAVAHPEHFRALSIARAVGQASRPSSVRANALAEANSVVLRRRRPRGQIATFPLDELMLAANAMVTGLAHVIVEGQLGEVDDARATELAIAVTGVLGLGLIPRDTPVVDPRRAGDCEPVKLKAKSKPKKR